MNTYKTTDNFMSFRILADNMPKLNKLFHNANEKLGKTGDIGYKIIGSEAIKIIGSETINNKTYFNVVASGVAKRTNMKFIARAEKITSNDKSDYIVKPFAQIKLSDGEKDKLKKICNGSCDCCGSKKAGKSARRDAYIFLCTEDDADGHKAGQYYQIGSSCVENWMGASAAELIKNLAMDSTNKLLNDDNAEHIVYVNPKEYLAYALVVGKTGFCDAYKHIKKSELYDKKTESSVCTAFNKYMKEIDIYKKESGEISTKALQLYAMSKGDCINPANTQVDTIIMSQLSRLMHIDELVKSKEIQELVNDIIEKGVNNNDFDILQESTIQQMLKLEVVHRNKTDILCAVADNYCLSKNELYMHEDYKPYNVEKNSIIGMSLLKDFSDKNSNNRRRTVCISTKNPIVSKLTREALLNLFECKPTKIDGNFIKLGYNKNTKQDDIIPDDGSVKPEVQIQNHKNFFTVEKEPSKLKRVKYLIVEMMHKGYITGDYNSISDIRVVDEERGIGAFTYEDKKHKKISNFYTGTFKNKPFVLNREYGGHSISDDELTRLLNGESIRLEFTSRKDKSYIKSGSLTVPYKNDNFIHFKIDGPYICLEDKDYYTGKFKGKDVSLKQKHGTHSFTKDEIADLIAGKTITFKSTGRSGTYHACAHLGLNSDKDKYVIKSSIINGKDIQNNKSNASAKSIRDNYEAEKKGATKTITDSRIPTRNVQLDKDNYNNYSQ